MKNSSELSLLAMWAFLVIFVMMAPDVYSQSCACPAVCRPCSGVIRSFSLQYNGDRPAVVSVKDNTTTIYTGQLSPGDIFFIQGSLPGNRFRGSEIYLYVDGQEEASIDVICTSNNAVNEDFDDFVIVSAISVDGNPVCCRASQTRDNIAPIFVEKPADIVTVVDAGKCTAAVTWDRPLVIDCNLEEVTSDYIAGSLFPIGITVVTYTAIDRAENETKYSFTVTVADNRPPLFVTAPSSVTTTVDKTICTAKVSWVEPHIAECDIHSIETNHSSGSAFPVGATTVTYTATDKSGNSSQHSFDVIVTDDEDPVFVTAPANIVAYTSPSACVSGPVTWTEPAINDCNLASVSLSKSSGSEFDLGETTVVYEAIDKAGNESSHTFVVAVKDNVPPLISECPLDIELKATDATGKIATWAPPHANDNCTAAVLSSSHNPGVTFPIGATVVTYKAVDGNGNSASCSFTIRVFLEGENETPPPPAGPATPTEPDINVSRVLTPDGDGKNDRWLIENIEKFQNKIQIIDRWGSVIFSADNYDNEKVYWDGLSGGSGKLPGGTYFYVISYRRNGVMVENKGFLELIP